MRTALIHTVSTLAILSTIATITPISAAALKPGKYRLAPLSAVDMRLDATDGSHANGKQIQIWKGNAGNPNQAWVFTKTGNGIYKIQPSYAPGLSMSVLANSSKNGAAVVLWADSGATGQRWAIKPIAGGYSLSPKCAPNTCLDVTGWSSSNGAKIQIWSATGKKNQTWAIAVK